MTEADTWRRGLTTAVCWLRVALLSWSSIVVIADATGTTEVRWGPALVVLAGLAAWTVTETLWLRSHPQRVAAAWAGVVEVVLGASVAALDFVIYSGPHPQSFGSAWPMSAAVVVGIWWGPRLGGAAGAVIGAAGALSTAVLSDGGLEGRVVAALGTTVLLIVAGAIAGMLTERLRTAEIDIARAHAREEVARQLHDGVLQTLAVIQRRSDDPQLVALARDQELDLRRYLLDGPPAPRGATSATPRSLRTQTGRSTDLVTALRDVLIDAERRVSMRCELVVIDAPERVPLEVLEAICGAVGEALTNADKHGGATRCVVCVDRDTEAVICTVNDDGAGFDPDATVEGIGLSRSIRGRMDDVGGRVEIVSRPGHGCEVLLSAPLPQTGGR